MARPRSTILPLHGGSFHPDFDDSGFSRCEAVSGLAPTNLTYPVHTFFSRCNFQALGIVLDKSQLSLRLATAFMVAGLPVFHATLCGNAEQIEGTDERGTRWILLNQNAGQTTFYLDANTTSQAYCSSLDASTGCFALEMPGHRSQIIVVKSGYDALAEAYDDPSYIICHHTSRRLRRDTSLSLHDSETFLVDGETTELGGFEMESYLFDGVIPESPFCSNLLQFDCDRILYSKLNILLTATEYPSASKRLVYELDFTAFAVRGGDPALDVVYNMSFLSMHKMFQDSFWRDDLIKKGRKALWFEKKTGYCFQADDKSSRTPMRAIGVQANLEISEVFWVDDSRVICKFDEFFHRNYPG